MPQLYAMRKDRRRGINGSKARSERAVTISYRDRTQNSIISGRSATTASKRGRSAPSVELVAPDRPG